MSEPRKKSKKNSEDTSVDWAEKLKASMNEGYSESDTQADHVDDDLAALLRAQLGKSTVTASMLDALDTSEFEEEFEEELAEELEEEFDEELEEEFDEELAEEFDEELEEEFEEELAEEFDEELEEEFEEEFEEELAEELEEEFEEEFAEELEEEFEEELAEELEEEFEEGLAEELEEEFEEEFAEEFEEELEEEFAEEFEDELEEEFDEELEEEFDEELEEECEDEVDDFVEDIEEDSLDDTEENASKLVEIPTVIENGSESSMSLSEYRPNPSDGYHRPVVDCISDDRLNGQLFEDVVGGPRLQAISNENERLWEESLTLVKDFSPDEESTVDRASELLDFNAGNEYPGTSETREAASATRRQAKHIHDPLQLGLDDVSPTFKRYKFFASDTEVDACESDDTIVMEGKDYPHVRTQDGIEESLQDMGLCLHLGYEDDLRHSDEQAQIEQLRTHHHETLEIKQADEVSPVHFKREYRGREDTPTVEKAYVKARKWNSFRLIYVVLGSLIACVYDLLPFVIPSNGELARSYVNYYAPIGLLGAMLICLPFLTRLINGIKSLLNFEPSRYAVSATAILIALLHGGVSCLVSDPYELPLFYGVSLVMLAFSTLSEWFVTEGEHRAFTVVSSGKLARILTGDPTPSASALRQKLSMRTGDGQACIPLDAQSVLTAVRARRVADYFARTNRYNPYMGRLNYLIPVALLCSILCAGLSLIRGDGVWTEGVQVFTATYLACMPAAYIVALTLPLFRANGILQKKGAAVIGTAAPTEYSCQKSPHVIFADGHALKALYRKDVTLRGDEASVESRCMADMLFRLLDTPLAVEPALQNRSLDGYRIDIAEIADEFIRLYLTDEEIQRTTEIMMGSHEALTHRGIRLPKISMEQRYKKSEGSHVLYVAFNRRFHLAYAVEYRVGRTFAKTAMVLSDMGYQVSLASFDPLVDTDMEGINRLRRRTSVEVLRPTEYEPIHESSSGGLIVTGRSLDLLQPLIACRKMKRAYQKAHLISWLSMLCSLGLSVLAISLGGISWLSSGILTLWQLLGMGSMLAMSVTTVGNLSADSETVPNASNAEVKIEKNNHT